MTENLHRHRSHRRSNRLQQFLRSYKFEVIWVAVVALGIFLIFERMNIRAGLFGWLSRASQALLQGAGQVGETTLARLASATFSDIIGGLLIFGALVALVLRLRSRLLHNPAFSAQICPKCQGAIHRVHRTWFDRLINPFVPVRRFRCANRGCGWKGLRIHSTHSIGRVQPAPVTPKST